jgi:GGDEF domain-containing protein
MSQVTTKNQPNAAEAGASNPERFLTLLTDGAALGVPEVDHEAYQEFRDNIAKISLQLPDRLPEEEKLAQIRAVLREFDNYRKNAENAQRERLAGWRATSSFLFLELLHTIGIDRSAANPAQLLREIAEAETAQNIQSLRDRLESFLHPSGAESAPTEASQFKKADYSTANDNAAGLRGGGSAVERLKGIMASGGSGFIAVFRLSCLSMINQRFGPEAVEDCLMAVASYLTQGLHSDDTIYHWSDSSLLAILQGRANEQILTAELERVTMQTRETSVNIGGRSTMLRIPITFELTPIERLKTPEDLHKISLLKSSGRAR